MKPSLKNKTKLVALSEKASNILVKILEEKLPTQKTPTQNDIQFQQTLEQICQICPLLSDSYALIYNHVQKEKISGGDKYYKRLRKSYYP